MKLSLLLETAPRNVGYKKTARSAGDIWTVSI